MANRSNRLERTSSAYGSCQASKEAISVADGAGSINNITIQRCIFANCTRVTSPSGRR